MIDALFNKIDWLWICATLPIKAGTCFSFWAWVTYIFFVTGSLLATWCILRCVDEHMKHKTADRAKKDREEIDSTKPVTSWERTSRR